jgi:O-antigen/teichoic acid export membrane protein
MSAFNAFERADLVAVTLVAQRFTAAALGIVALAAGLGAVAVAVAYGIGAVVRLVLSFFLLGRRLGMPAVTFPEEGRRELRSRSLPFMA